MTQKSLSVRNNFTALLTFAAIAAISIISCKKTSPISANAKFAGDWTGSTTCWSVGTATTVATNTVSYFGAGSEGNLLTIGWSFGEANCYRAVPVEGTVNNYSFSIAPQNFSDNCGAGYLISGNGSLSLSGVLTYTTTVTSATVVTCAFSGVKD